MWCDHRLRGDERDAAPEHPGPGSGRSEQLLELGNRGRTIAVPGDDPGHVTGGVREPPVSRTRCVVGYRDPVLSDGAETGSGSGEQRGATVLTLCTGNAARSVMAGAMLHSGHRPIATAGTHVIEGQPMSRRTRAALKSVGFSADGHRSHQITEADIDDALLILAMAAEHVAYIRRKHPDAAHRTASIKRLVRDLPAGPEPLADRLAALGLADVDVDAWEDVEDPAGGDDTVYVSCAQELADLCARLLPLLDGERATATD